MSRAGRRAKGVFLDDACAGRPELRTQVESLLKAHGDAGSFLDGPAFDGQRTSPMEPIAEGPGTTIGPYKLLEQIGEGGFGVVFMAEQQQPVRRKVALKIVKPGMDTRQVVARFEAERQALALMDHPNIAKVFDAGATAAGRPYFVMELVRGIPITDFCDQPSADVRERLELFTHGLPGRAARASERDHPSRSQAVQRHGDACTMATPVVKVIDFGVAKATGQQLTEKTLFTHFRADDRHADVHEPRAGADERPGRRYAQRCLLAGRVALRAADRHHAV